LMGQREIDEEDKKRDYLNMKRRIRTISEKLKRQRTSEEEEGKNLICSWCFYWALRKSKIR